MTTERVYDIKVNGADSMNELKSAVSELTEKLKSLDQTSKEYLETLKQLTDYQQKLADAMGGISDSAEKTDNSLNGIKETVDSVADSISSLGEDVINSFAEGLAQGMAEAAAETTQMSESMDNGVNSVKGLKQEISDLRDKLVTLDNGTDEYKETVQQLINDQVKLKEVMNAGKNETQAAEGSYNALTQRMSALKQVWKETTDEATRNEIGQQINEINNQLKAMDASIGNNQRNVGNYKSALEGLDASFVNWKQELRECKEALQQLDPSTQEYADTLARASELTHQMADQQEMIKYSSTDLGDQLSNINGIASNLAAGYSAVNAAMGLFGEENEEVQQAMLKVQQAMALVQGLQGIDGFIKRTKGLSQSMGLVTKATQSNTNAMRANAAATKADTVAKGAEATATAGVIPAQLGLNAAMKANPIGFIIGLVASLIAIFSLLKDKIMEMIGSNKEMSAAFDKVKAVLSGFGNVIKKSIINPIKMAIIPIKTLAKVMIDLFKGDWSKIGDDIKEGFTEMKDNVVDTINVVGAFKEGYDKKVAEQNEAARKKEAEARAKDRDEYIKDMEAKHKADWKYTEEGKKAYEEYYNSLLEMYDKDSEEYRQALRDKEAYLRDFNEKQIENSENIAALELKLDIAKYGEEIKYSEEYYKKEQKLYQDAMKERAKYMPPLANIEPIPYEVEERILNAEIRWRTYLKSRNDYYKKQNEKFTKDTEKFVNDFKSKFDSLVNDSDKALRSTYQTVSALTATMKIGGKDYEAIDMYMKEWEKLFRTIYGLDEQTIQLKLKKVRDDITSGAVKKSWDEYVKSISKTLTNELYNMDKTVQAFVGKLQQTFNEDKITIGIDFPKDEIDNIEQIYGAQMDNLYEKTINVRKDIDVIFPMLARQFAESLGKDVSAVTEAEIGQLVPEFQKLLDEEQTFVNNYLRLNTEMFQKESDVWAKEWNNKIDVIKKGNKETNDLADQTYKELINNAKRWQGVYGNALRDVYEDMDYFNRYDEQIKQLEELRDKYNEIAQDEKLTFEEKEKAKREAAKITGEITQLEFDKEVERLRLQKELIKQWTNAVKDATAGVADILGTLGDSWSSLIELEKTEIAQQLENGEINEEEAKRREEANKESFENLKKLQIAQAIINTLAAAVSAYQSMASIPYVGPALGAAAAAAALVAGYAQVRQIQATNYESGSSSVGGGGGGSTNFQLPSVLELEPDLQGRMTGMSDTDELNNAGGRGRGETAIRAFIVESEVSASQELARKRSDEITF